MATINKISLKSKMKETVKSSDFKIMIIYPV
jgi:hypothetical protein